MGIRTDGETSDYWQGSPATRRKQWQSLDSPDPDGFSQNMMDVTTKNAKGKGKKGKRGARNSRKNYVGKARTRTA